MIALWLMVSAAAPSAPVERFAQLALDCVHKEWPNKLSHVLNGPSDVATPHELTPAFYGCYDWHSSVHGHWLLARLLREFPDAPFAAGAKAELAKSLTAKNLELELGYFKGAGRASFERPYGLAWLLQLGVELRALQIPEAQAWREALAPLEDAVAERLETWLPKLTNPIRSGEHSQTAFAFGLALDWARATKRASLEKLLLERGRAFYAADVACPLSYEPSGEDFLSPCVAEADFMRRVLDSKAFATWLTKFFPTLKAGKGVWLAPAIVSDPSDPKLAHLDGLNLSRAWMLEGIAAALPATDPRRAKLLETAEAHAKAGLAAVTGEHYEGGHWLGTFATYLVTKRGLE